MKNYAKTVYSLSEEVGLPITDATRSLVGIGAEILDDNYNILVNVIIPYRTSKAESKIVDLAYGFIHLALMYGMAEEDTKEAKRNRLQMNIALINEHLCNKALNVRKYCTTKDYLAVIVNDVLTNVEANLETENFTGGINLWSCCDVVLCLKELCHEKELGLDFNFEDAWAKMEQERVRTRLGLEKTSE